MTAKALWEFEKVMVGEKCPQPLGLPPLSIKMAFDIIFSDIKQFQQKSNKNFLLVNYD